MKKPLMTQVANSIFDVMETMFYFTLTEKKDAGTNMLSLFELKELKASSIRFSGDYSGSIFLFIPSAFLTAMTQNFMRIEASCESEELLNETLKEALNIIAGNALTKVDKKSYVKLGIPEMIVPADTDIDIDFVAFEAKQGLIASFVRMNN